MLTISSDIEPAALQRLLVEDAQVVFEDTQCSIISSKGSLIGDSPYGYIDFLMPANSDAWDAAVLWSKSWVSFNPSYAS